MPDVSRTARRVLPSVLLAFVAHAVAAVPQPAPAELADLPLVVLPADVERTDLVALLMTGDGGWMKLAREVSGGLHEAGIPVVGLDSKRYFRDHHSPEEAARDVARVLSYYLRLRPQTRFVLVGYSRGADTLPFAIHGLSSELDARVALAVLLNPAIATRFAADRGGPEGGAGRPASRPLQPEIDALPDIALLCVYGVGERDALCPTLAPERYDVLAIGRGHHFSGDYAAIVAAILARTPDAGAHVAR